MEDLDIKEVVQIITGKVIDKIPKDLKIRYKKILSKDGNLKNYFEYGLFLSLWIDEANYLKVQLKPKSKIARDLDALIEQAEFDLFRLH